MSDVLGIGVDLCAVDRIEKAMEKEHFAGRIYTQAEREYIQGRGAGGAQSAAAMYAAKEAAAKALGTGFAAGVAPWNIEVTHGENGAPAIRLHDGAEERLRQMGGREIRLSLSHEGNTAIAFAVITG